MDLRFAQDNDGELYILTKSDGMIRKVVGVKEPVEIRAFRTLSGVTLAKSALNVPFHRDSPLLSATVPCAASRKVVPPAPGERMNGEPAKKEHDGSFGSKVPGHIVLFTPGPVPDRKKFRLFPPTTKVMNGLPGGVTDRGVRCTGWTPLFGAPIC